MMSRASASVLTHLLFEGSFPICSSPGAAARFSCQKSYRCARAVFLPLALGGQGFLGGVQPSEGSPVIRVRLECQVGVTGILCASIREAEAQCVRGRRDGLLGTFTSIFWPSLIREGVRSPGGVLH